MKTIHAVIVCVYSNGAYMINYYTCIIEPGVKHQVSIYSETLLQSTLSTHTGGPPVSIRFPSIGLNYLVTCRNCTFFL